MADEKDIVDIVIKEYDRVREVLKRLSFGVEPIPESPTGAEAIYFISDGTPYVVGAMNRKILRLVEPRKFGDYHEIILTGLQKEGLYKPPEPAEQKQNLQ